MNLYIIISNISILIWLIVPFRQYKTKYFNYFLVSALFEIIVIIVFFVLKISPNYFYPAYYLFLLAMLVEKKQRYYILFLGALSFIVLPVIEPRSVLLFVPCAILATIILIIVLRTIVELFLKTYQINLFLLLFFIYLAIDFSKLIDISINLQQGSMLYYIGVVSQMFFGVAFCFININTKNYKVRIKALDE